MERPIGGVVQLEQGSVGAQQAGRLPDHVLEEVAGLADRGDPRGDLAQCLLVRSAPFDDRLGALELLHQAGVDERDRGLTRQTGEQLGVDLAVHVRRPGHDRDHADGSILAGERRGEDRADARLLDEARDPVGRLEAIVGRVVGRDERPLLGEREPRHALARLQSARDRPVGDVLHRFAGRVAPAQDPQLVVVQVDPRAVRLEEPCRLVDDPLEHLAGIEDRGDARVDLAQGPLRVGAPRDLLARTFELLDQARVHDRHRALVGQRAEHGGVLGAECTRLVAVDGQHAEDLVVAHERCRDHRADAGVADEGVAFRRVREALVVEVVVAPLDLAGPQRAARHARVLLEADLLQQLDAVANATATRQMRPGVVQHARDAGQVDHRAAAAEEARGLLVDHLEDLVLVAHGRHSGGDLAQRPLRTGGAGLFAARSGELLDEAGVGDGDGRVAGEDLDELAVLGGERVRTARVHLDDAEPAGVAGDRRRDHRAEPRPAEEQLGLGRLRKLRDEVVARDDHPVLGQRTTGRPDAELDPQVGALLCREEQRQARVEGPAQDVLLRVEDVQDRAVGVDQPARLVDGPLEDRIEVGGTADPCRDLAQAALDLGAPGQLTARPVEVGDEAGIGHGRSRVVGERSNERDLGGVERLGPDRERAERAEHLVAADHRRDDHRADPHVLDDLVRVGRVREGRVVRVVIGLDDRTIGNGSAEHSRSDRQLDPPDPAAAARAADAGIEREAQDAGVGVEQVDHRAVRVQEAGGLVDRAHEHRVDAGSVRRDRRRLRCAVGISDRGDRHRPQRVTR